jgi:hypothetical protein
LFLSGDGGSNLSSTKKSRVTVNLRGKNSAGECGSGERCADVKAPVKVLLPEGVQVEMVAAGNIC